MHMTAILDRWIGQMILVLAVLLGCWRTGSNIVLGITMLLILIRFGCSFRDLSWNMDHGLIRAAGIYFFAIGITSLFSEDVRTSILAGQDIFRYCLVFFAFWPFIRQAQVQHKILYCFAAGIGIGGAIIVLANLIPALHNHARTGLLGIMNYGGAAAILLPGTTVLALLEKDPKIKRWLIVAIFFGGLGLLYNGTRGAWIAAGLAMLLTIALFWRPRIKQVLLLGAVIIIVAGIASQSAFLSQRIKSTDRQDSSIVLRLGMWKLGLESWGNHKLAGSGLGRAPTYTYQPDDYGKLHTVARERVDYQDRVHIHNLYVQTLAESGLIGAAGLFYMIGWILNSCRRRLYSREDKRMARFLFVGFTGFLLHNLTDYAIGIPTEFVLILIIMAGAYGNFSEEQKLIV